MAGPGTKTSPPVFAGATTADFEAQVDQILAHGLPPQVGRAWTHFTKAIGVRLPNNVHATYGAIRRINRIR